MDQFEGKQHRRRSIRLPAFDYAQPGAYFVTMVTHQRKHLFGRIDGEKVTLSAFGRVVADCWREIPAHFPTVSNEIFVVMPNHFHGIIDIQDEMEGDGGDVVVGARHASPVREGIRPNSLGAIIGSFKSAVTRKIHQLPDSEKIIIWQRNYYERIIRDSREYERVADYIHANPANWAADRENRKRLS